ncbi:MAG: hypothetical protein HRU29_03955 [Rhizobiales bacterium]|nr:hypothetical protein [Hyphomicrobiales bacterium]NRB13535.1 hypothetical protein [Hyphomicrobiales bacterium]
MHLQSLNPTPPRRDFEFKYNLQIRKTETMFLKFLSNFFWLKNGNDEHSLARLPGHLKRDMGLIEPDINPKMAHEKPVNSSPVRASIWL